MVHFSVPGGDVFIAHGRCPCPPDALGAHTECPRVASHWVLLSGETPGRWRRIPDGAGARIRDMAHARMELADIDRGVFGSG